MNRKNKTVCGIILYSFTLEKIATIVIYLFWGGYLSTEWFCYILDGWLGYDFFPSGSLHVTKNSNKMLLLQLTLLFFPV